jgi:hypothetical protein
MHQKYPYNKCNITEVYKLAFAHYIRWPMSSGIKRSYKKIAFKDPSGQIFIMYPAEIQSVIH